MKLRITTFAQLKDHFEPNFTLELPEDSTAGDALLSLAKLRPEAEPILEASRIAINEEIVSVETPLEDGQNLFVLPPASGG